MSAVTVNTPYPTFTDIDGQPLEDGYVWIGVSGLEPQANPQTAYWDAALTQVVTQPVRTRGGYPLNGTAIGRLYTGSSYSIKVQNKNSSTLVLDLTGAAGTGVGSISFGTTGLTPAVATDGDVVVAGTLAVANGGTGLAAGTSGGIPYFSSASAMTSSGALAANALMIGGGAGVAPSTTTTGAGILTFLGTPSSANLAAAVTDETGSGSLVFGTSPTLSGATLNGTTTFGGSVTPASNTVDSVGYTGTPVNSQSAAYQLVAADAGKSIVHPITDNNARTFTIPANGTVPFPVGTAITFINMINTVTIAITTDTMYLAGAGTTGSRTLAAYGMATAVKVSSTSWIISGNGLT